MSKNNVVYLLAGLAAAFPLASLLMLVTILLKAGGYETFYPFWLVAIEFVITLAAAFVAVKYGKRISGAN